MMNQTTWRPDTCDCKIIYEWDSSVPDDQRVHTLVSMEKCAHHNQLTDTLAYDKVLNEENKLKNMAIGDLNLTELEKEEISWAFDKNRNLEITLPIRKTAGEKDTSQSLLDSKYGQGKITIK